MVKMDLFITFMLYYYNKYIRRRGTIMWAHKNMFLKRYFIIQQALRLVYKHIKQF